MPGCAIHLELAGRVLRGWQAQAAKKPFPPDDPSCRRAFLFGSLAPDLGYFPGGDGLLAELAHCVRTSELARNLIATAKNEQDIALAWGWVTHILADVWIHPLINQAAAERITGRRTPGLTYVDDPATHVRVELGLDAILPLRDRWPDPDWGRSLDPGRCASEALARAFRQTYGFEPSVARMRVVNRLSTRFVAMLLQGGRVVSGRPTSALTRLAHRGAASLTRRLGRGGSFEALSNPFPPPDWLLDETSAVVESFCERFQHYYASNLEGLPDFNLDTGEVEEDPPRYLLTVAALEKVGRRRPASRL